MSSSIYALKRPSKATPTRWRALSSNRYEGQQDADRIIARAKEQGQQQIREPERGVSQAQHAVPAKKTYWQQPLTVAWARRLPAKCGRSSSVERKQGSLAIFENVGTGPQCTTAAMLRMERETIAHM
ncbi:hypothetical protein [Granulicella sp. dw_53]|uniref:hypothetical protein n=1 Tax=Granulicella sp. dw_53 TaxID=2719792 RepID=UPI001BD4A5A1|nr:hypothetical protein [Granulicella sp. dw_53]